MKPIIDSHVHFWNMAHPDHGLRWAWLERGAIHPILGDIDAIKAPRFEVDNAFAEARFAHVSAFVHVQAAIGSDDPVKETVWLSRMREDSPAPFTIVAHADLGKDHALKQLDGHADSPYFVGVRDFATEPLLSSGIVDPVFESSLRELSKRGLVFDLDCEWQNMGAAVELAKRHPDLQIVLEHFGYPRTRTDEYFANWNAAIRELGRAENVSCKISGAAMTDPHFTEDSLRRWVEGTLEAFGPERCMLGSNWPVDRLFSSYDAIMGLYRRYLSTLADDEETQILSANAARIYGL